MRFRLKDKQENGAADGDAPMTTTFVVPSASGTAVAVPEPLDAAEIEKLKEKTTSDVMSDVAKARSSAGLA
jgi:hypothetical protein